MHAAFVADEIWGFMLEPARSQTDKFRISATDDPINKLGNCDCCKTCNVTIGETT